MADQDDAAEKSHEPSQKKLDDARRKGEIVRSNDLNLASSYLGTFLILAVFGSAFLTDFGSALHRMISTASHSASVPIGEWPTPVLSGVMWTSGAVLLKFAAAPFALVVLVLTVQRAWLFTGSKIQPKVSRLSILKNAKNKFGRNGLFEFGKSFVKMMIYSVVLTYFLIARFAEIISQAQMNARSSLILMGELLLSFISVVVAVSVTIAGVDYLWQAAEHRRKNMMSHKELKDEHKESEGDPHFKNARRSRAQEIALSQMLADVPGADVVVVNPTHYAVALKWDGTKNEAPRCVAKGVDEIALKIREAAKEAGVAIHSDPPTARAMHAVLDVGQEILPEHYQAVAIAIRFAEGLKEKNARRPWQ